MPDSGEIGRQYHETKADHAESKPPVESLSGSFSQSGLEHSRPNRIPHVGGCRDMIGKFKGELDIDR